MTGKPAPTFVARCAYAFIGLVSGGVFFLFVSWVLGYVFAEFLDDSQLLWFVIAGSPVIFGLLMAVWGFFATDDMTDTLAGWWEALINQMSDPT